MRTRVMYLMACCIASGLLWVRNTKHFVRIVLALWLFINVSLAPVHAADPAQLTIGNGVVVKFGQAQGDEGDGSGIVVRGRLATGADVVLTSERDDQTGGQTGASPATAQRGDWLGLFLAPGLAPSDVAIDGLTLRYAGGDQGLPAHFAYTGAALVVPGGTYTFSGLRISHSTIGLRVVGPGSAQILQSRIENNRIGVQAEQGATPTIQQSSLAQSSFYGVSNENPSTPVQASGNWWGHVTGPRDTEGNPAGQGSRVSPGVIYQPYLTADPALGQGPALAVQFNGQVLSANTTLQRTGVLSLSAHSALGVSALEAYIDGVAVLQQGYPSPGPTSESNPVLASQLLGFTGLANASHVLVATARDPQGGTTTVTLPFVLDLRPPEAPVITRPTAGATFTMSSIGVAGTAEPAALVQMFANNQPVGQPIQAGESGAFSGSIVLPGDGIYSLQAQASNPRGAGPTSAAVSVTVAAPAPTVVFISPSDQATVRGLVPVQISAIDANGIAQVVVEARDASSRAYSLGNLTQAPWALEWDSTALPNGSYTLVATATSMSGKSSQASRVVLVEQLPPPPPPPPLPDGTPNLSVTPALSFGDQPIQITGQVATLGTDALPVPNATLRLALRVQGFERRITLVSDSAGQFSYTFVPQSNDAGTYAVYVVHPDDTQYASQAAPAQFTINRLSFNYSHFKLNAIRGQATSVELMARASAGTGATGVRWQALPADQPSGSLPPGITLDMGQPVDVPAGAGVPISLKLTGSASAGATGTVILKAFANESGSRPRAELRVDYQLHEAMPGLSPSPSFVEIGVQQGGSASAAVTVTNRGLALARKVRAKLVTPQGGTPPAWVRLVSSGEVGDLDVGQSVPLQVTAQPGADVADGYYQYQLNVSADNDAGGSVPVTVAVAQSGQGGVRFKLVDIYTNTLNASGQPIPGVSGATIKLQNEALTAEIRTLTTNDQGLAELTDLPPGNYRWRASAAQHTDASGRIQVRAGLTANERVFLDNQLVSIEFSVTETTIRDEYHITLEATFQTQVPAPVVLLEPLSVNLPDMQVGEEITGELALSNYGLVRADELEFALPQSDASYRYEFFGDMPTELAAKSRVVIPYRITAVAPVKRQSLAMTTGRTTPAVLPLFKGYSPSLQIQHAIRHLVSTGSSPAVPKEKAEAVAKATGCNSYVTSTCVGYAYTCAAGDKRQSSTCTSISRISGASCGSGDSTSIYIPGPSSIGGDGWGRGGYGGGSGAPIGLVPACVPTCPDCSGGTGPGGGGGGGGSGPGPGGSGPGPGGPGPSSFGSS